MTAKTIVNNTRLSILDLSPITHGGSAAESFRNSLSLAQHAESLGYNRYWVAEHHGMAGITYVALQTCIRPLNHVRN